MLISFFSILFLMLVFYLSMMPIVLFIDTKTNQYYLQIKGLVKASIESHEEELILNAKLYPVFALLNYHFGGLMVNFEGRNRVELQIYSRPIYLIKSFLNL